MKYNLMDHLLNPVIVTDENFKIIYYNHICSTYFKLPPRKLNKIVSIENLIITDQINILDKIKTAKEFSTPIVSKEIDITLPEVESNSQTVILKFIPFESETIIHLWDFSIEKHLHEKYKLKIQELKETHEQIMQSDKLAALGELISGIGHEVSNPLTIISDRIYRIEENLITSNMDELSDNIKDIDQGVKRISKIVSNLQSFIKNQDEELEIVSLDSVINESLTFISDLEILNDIKILTNKKEDILVFANNIKLQQVVINLVKNSIDALDSTKSPQIDIKLSLDEIDHSVYIELIDNGPGIPVDLKDKVFEMFYTSKEYGEGTGLGLSISQKILKSFNGELKIEDVKKGACFKISLPLIEFSTFSQTNDYLTGEKDQEDPKILLLGDNVEKLNEIYNLLEKENIVIIISKNTDKLDELIDFYSIDYIFHFGLKKTFEIPDFDLSLNPNFNKDSLLSFVGHHE